MQHGIEQSVWSDPHLSGDHGFVEWVQVVVDERTLLATAEGTGTGLEEWRCLRLIENPPSTPAVA